MTEAEITQKIIDNKKLVHLVLNQYFNSFRDDEDMIQAGMIGLWKAIKTYDKTKAAFSTYAAKVIKSQILMELRPVRKNNKLNPVSIETLIISEEEITLGDVIEDKTDCFAEICNLESIQQKIKTLSDREKYILRLTYNGETQRSIGRKLGISRTGINRILKKIKNQLETND
jgi:RNA polymerase sporulation-specific sigma factor